MEEEQYGVDQQYGVDTVQPPPPSGGGGSSMSPNFSFLRTPSGVMMVINTVLLFLCWCIMAGWKGNVHSLVAAHIDGTTSFFLFTTVFPWIVMLILFVLLILQLHTRLTMINWPLTFVINCVLWAALLLISSSVVASKADDYPCVVWKCDGLRAAAAFGFITTAGLLVQAFFHFREFRSG